MLISLVWPSNDEIRELERKTREQRNSPKWFAARRFWITASIFGDIIHRRPETAPDNLVKRILQQKRFFSVQTEWCINKEEEALQSYIDYQNKNGHVGLTVYKIGFLVMENHPHIGASPDGDVYDPSSEGQEYGFLEIKCPYTHRNKSIEEACRSSGFCSELRGNDNKPSLRRMHRYYPQVQGQMAVGERPWCDFVLFTTKDISVEWIKFDSSYWENDVLHKLSNVYNNCLAPEITQSTKFFRTPNERDLSKTQ